MKEYCFSDMVEMMDEDEVLSNEIVEEEIVDDVFWVFFVLKFNEICVVSFNCWMFFYGGIVVMVGVVVVGFF